MKHMEIKINKIILLVSAMILCCGLLTACGKSKGKSEIVGTWNDVDGGSKFIFNEDGTWIFDASCPANGTWTITEGKTNEIQMPSQSGLGQDMWHVGGVHEFSIEGNRLNLYGVGEYEKE